MAENIKISIVIPYYKTENSEKFLERCLESIRNQTYKNYEILVPEKGKSSENTNAGIKQATGDVIKILHMDDYFSSPNSLQEIVDLWPFKWLVTGCIHDDGLFFGGEGHLFNRHLPKYTDDIVAGFNEIGAPSVLAFENKDPLMFDKDLVWVLDCDYYKRLYDRYGLPTVLDKVNVVIGIHKGQATNLISDAIKNREEMWLWLMNEYD